MSNEPLFRDPHASPEAFFAAYPGEGPQDPTMPERPSVPPADVHDRPTLLDPLGQRASLTSLDELPLDDVEAQGPSDKFRAALNGHDPTAIDRVTTPPMHAEHDTERPGAPLPTPLPDTPTLPMREDGLIDPAAIVMLSADVKAIGEQLDSVALTMADLLVTVEAIRKRLVTKTQEEIMLADRATSAHRRIDQLECQVPGDPCTMRRAAE